MRPVVSSHFLFPSQASASTGLRFHFIKVMRWEQVPRFQRNSEHGQKGGCALGGPEVSACVTGQVTRFTKQSKKGA